ncbi:hypothetical protein A3J34_02415 [Candidatus Peribacteria bacterium RIFCSPLOWO2_02_FULL_51_10]|nr:MAG: hypothetical protein A3C52_05375 [Candidatus Peribacteria bacterium RIFCSPHIGHO2_02_FULL_51_15]OGJ68482.1 MAG: hypothetical protein A3J34_02415 [Candidatus Peribacteria bacterium RIFCSPLOWO2_02_FULL_51_10]
MLETLLYPGILWCTIVYMSDNFSGADNQQESLHTTFSLQEFGYYLAGFTDGEGSFNISFRKRKDYKFPWKVSACFNISQKEERILRFVQKTLGCGTLRSRPDGIWYYEANTLNDIRNYVIPFFHRFKFISQKKQRDFKIFCTIVDLLSRGVHLTKKGVIKILDLRRIMNDGGKRKYSEQDILNAYGESSETIRRTFRKG